MYKVTSHPILEVPEREKATFQFNGNPVRAEMGYTIAAALHQAGYPVHSHSLSGRNRSLECGIGKCGACEMLVDGKVCRICITQVDGVKEVTEITNDYEPRILPPPVKDPVNVYKTQVLIIGAGPAGLASRELLNKHNVSNIVIDNNEKIGGQFLMQTHQFFFFEKEQHFGGMRGFDIARRLAGENLDGIFLDSTVWDILEGRRIAVKNIKRGEIYYVDSEYLIVATGAVPFMPAFENDDLPGVYTAAVVQKMMNMEFTLLGKNILTVGAGNIGYLTSYQLFQAGAKVKAIIEAQNFEGGFPVQANRVRRLGIPILTSHILLKALPNKQKDGIAGAIVAESRNFQPVPSTEKTIEGIDAINICTGLVSDDQLMMKGYEVFGRNCYGAGDALRIGEGTSAVLRGQQAAFEIIQAIGQSFSYSEYLVISKDYIDSQQEPVKVRENPFLPGEERMDERPFVIIDCLYGFACNPCEFACPHGAITKTSTSTIPEIDYNKCTGCMACVYQCPGLAIFGYNRKNNWLFLPIEYPVNTGIEVYLVDNHGEQLGRGKVEKVLLKKNKTNIARIKSLDIDGEKLTEVRGFISVDEFPEPVTFSISKPLLEEKKFICHCDDVTLEEILETIGDRKFISVDEVKHTTRLGMGACRGKRCIKRLKQTLTSHHIQLVGDATPRGPLSNQISIGELYPKNSKEKIITTLKHIPSHKIKVNAFIAGGGIGGSALFRYLAEAGEKPLMINFGRGASWRNIAAGRPNFSIPELADIARNNLGIFRSLQERKNIDFRPIDYVTFAHDDNTLRALEASLGWSEGYLVEPKDYTNKISPQFNPQLKNYLAALVTKDCWQATPGRVIDLIRTLGIEAGGSILEDCKLIDLEYQDGIYTVVVQDHNQKFLEYETAHFINALGPEGDKYARKLGIITGIYPVKHQAFITRRLPYMGIKGIPLPMLIDRKVYKGFSAVYGQQLAETGQIIGCASPAIEPSETDKNLKINSKEFIEIVSEVFVNWIPELTSVGFQAIWAGYYVEPRMIVDPEAGLFLGLRGQGFMLGQYLAKLYVDKLLGKPVPDYFERLALSGDGLPEKAFK